jgi:hypothetical protein
LLKDLRVLTPNMLWTGKEFLSMPLREGEKLATSDFGMHPTKRWEHVNNLAANFWRRWGMEYVATLQPRNKWAKEERSFVPGDMVLVTDERDPPLCWPLGRIVKTFTGNDEVGRCVLVRTIRGEQKRPANKCRLLPTKTETFNPDVVMGGAQGDLRRVSRVLNQN